MEIRVYVTRRKGRRYFQCEWVDPLTGKLRSKSTKTSVRRDAERIGGRLEKELNEGTYQPPSKVTWETFRRRYEEEVVPGLAEKTSKKVAAVFNSIERHINPKKLAALDSEQISRFQKAMRDEELAEPSIKSHLAHLKAALRWAKRMKLLREVPEISMPKRTETMRGRPLTKEELERMIDATEAVVGAERAPSWQHLIEGLYLSGLRLGESLRLSWDDDSKILVDLSRRRPMLVIPPAMQKRHKHDLTPIVPEFLEFLQRTPEDQRTGFVFNPVTAIPKRYGRLKEQCVGRTIGKIGEKANVVVKKVPKIEYASAHDLRRSFLARWAGKVLPQVLMKLARHSSIATTLTYYAGSNAETTADAIWSAVSDTSPDTSPKSPDSAAQEKVASPESIETCD